MQLVPCLLGRHIEPKLSIASIQNVSHCRLIPLHLLSQHFISQSVPHLGLHWATANGSMHSSSMPSRMKKRPIRSSMVFYHDTLLYWVGTISLWSYWLRKGRMWMHRGKYSINHYFFRCRAFIATYFVITSCAFCPGGTLNSYGCPRLPRNFAFLHKYTNSMLYTDIPSATPTDTTTPPLILQPPTATRTSSGLCSSTTHTQIWQTNTEWCTKC